MKKILIAICVLGTVACYGSNTKDTRDTGTNSDVTTSGDTSTTKDVVTKGDTNTTQDGSNNGTDANTATDTNTTTDAGPAADTKGSPSCDVNGKYVATLDSSVSATLCGRFVKMPINCKVTGTAPNVTFTCTDVPVVGTVSKMCVLDANCDCKVSIAKGPAAADFTFDTSQNKVTVNLTRPFAFRCVLNTQKK